MPAGLLPFEGTFKVRSPFRVFHSLVLALFGTLAYKLLQQSRELEAIPDYGVYANAGIIGLLWVLFSYSRSISDKLLEWLPVTRRLFAGSKHIEGDWPLVVVNGRTGTLIYYGFLTISFAEGQYVVKGSDWHPDGRHALNFASMQTYQAHPVLHYWYQQGEGGRQRGYTFIEFFPTDEIPTRMTGVFHDREHPDVRFYARKIRYGWFERRLKGMEVRRLAGKAFADEITPKLSELVHLSVDADWD